MNVLVVGYGSIGARHARILTEIGLHAAVVSNRTVDLPKVYASLREALATEHPGYVVIANATGDHRATLAQLAEYGYSGVVVVEKPLFDTAEEFCIKPFARVCVAYNLRFHPVIQQVRSLIQGEKVLSVHAYVGQYLPDWRPSGDYRKSYSANNLQGGGVLRDLSHELDYLTWLLGGWKRVVATGGHFSSLEITSDDVFSMMLDSKRCPLVTLQMNYLDRVGRRSILINTDRHTIEADLVRGNVMVDRDVEFFALHRDDTYRSMHQSILSRDEQLACSFIEGFETMRLIEAVEASANQGAWVSR